MESCVIDDFGPLPVVRPTSVVELSDSVRRATAANTALYPLGGRTMLDLGLPPLRPGFGVDMTALADVIDYPARDMTVTVHAGITLAALGDLLASEKQRLPVDVPHADRATLGGALAANVSGPRRYGFGTLRDYVIGISTVNDEGHETKAGGRVVKNVAGYDLCKLHIGALGTLGIISQVTLKVRPLPEATAILTLGCEDVNLGPLLDRLHASRTRPVCVDVLNANAVRTVAAASRAALPSAPWVVVVGYEDRAETVDWQVQQILTEVAAGAACRASRPGPGRLANRCGGPWSNSLPARLPGFRSRPTCCRGRRRDSAWPCRTRICRSRSRHTRGPESCAATLTATSHRTAPGTGTAVADGGERGPWQCRADCAVPRRGRPTLPVWGVPCADWPLMRRVKDKLDPHRLFNPGRYVGGI